MCVCACVCHCECVSLLAEQWGDCSPVFSPSARERVFPTQPLCSPFPHTTRPVWGCKCEDDEEEEEEAEEEEEEEEIQLTFLNENSRTKYVRYIQPKWYSLYRVQWSCMYFNWTEKCSIQLFQEDPGTTCANATNVCYELVWKDLALSELRAPLDKEEKGRLIKEWPCGQTRAKTRLPWPYALSSSPRSANRKISYFTQHRSQWHLHWRG